MQAEIKVIFLHLRLLCHFYHHPTEKPCFAELDTVRLPFRLLTQSVSEKGICLWECWREVLSLVSLYLLWGMINRVGKLTSLDCNSYSIHCGTMVWTSQLTWDPFIFLLKSCMCLLRFLPVGKGSPRSPESLVETRIKKPS